MKLFKQSINLFNSIKYQVQLKHLTFLILNIRIISFIANTITKSCIISLQHNSSHDNHCASYTNCRNSLMYLNSAQKYCIH